MVSHSQRARVYGSYSDCTELAWFPRRGGSGAWLTVTVTELLLIPPAEVVLTTNDSVLADVKEAERTLTSSLHYDIYGKNLIKRFKTSSDAWAQLVEQLAFDKLEGRPAVTHVRKCADAEVLVWANGSHLSDKQAEQSVGRRHVDPNATDVQRTALGITKNLPR
ncbi:hypothetical protein EDB89DRAFT_859940 [Lactarius sanguifluus]|nr:hypothetical protein EDB89DRAFT_859940 [Lactarius sanguifluus]